MEGSLRVFLLGGFRVEMDGAALPPEAWRHRRGADVVKLLALSPGHRLHRERVIDALWPDLPPDAGAANLRKALHYARRALEDEGVITLESGMVALRGVEVDLDRLEAAADAEAIELYAGDLLPEDEYEPWSREARDRARRRYLGALKATGSWQRVIELDPLDESSYRELMTADLEAGDRQGAMRRFERLRTVLHEELGVGPDLETVALYERVLAMEGTEPATLEERARAHLAAGLVALHRQELEEAEREARAARELAIEAQLGKELGEASGLLGMVAHMRGTWRDLFGRETVEILEKVPSLAEHVLDAHLCLAEFSLYAPGGSDHAEEVARDLLEIAERRGSEVAVALANLMRGERELLAGRLASAADHLTRAVDLYSKEGTSSAHAMAVVRLAEVAIADGDQRRAHSLMDEAERLAHEAALASHLIVRVYCGRVRAQISNDDAIAVVREAQAELDGREVCDPCSMGFLAAAAICSARAGDAEAAGRYLGDAERVAGMWQGGAWAAAVWEARAELRLAEKDPRQAAALFREAAAGFARAGHPLDEARAEEAAGKAEALAS